MFKIEEYIKRPLSERRSHLKLEALGVTKFHVSWNYENLAKWKAEHGTEYVENLMVEEMIKIIDDLNDPEQFSSKTFEDSQVVKHLGVVHS